MFANIFESAAPRYYLPEELSGVPDGIGLGSLYNPYLVTPPRYYAEALRPGGFLIGAFTKKEATPYSNFTLHLMAGVDWIYYPGYHFRHWWFDGLTGIYLGTDDLVTNTLFGEQVTQARDGGLWVSVGGGTPTIYEADPLTFAAIPGTVEAPSKYGASTISMPMVDRAQNLIVAKTNNEAFYELGVYDFTSGALVRRIGLSGTPTQIFPEDDRRCYVLTSEQRLSLIDYTTGETISTLRAPGIEVGAAAYLYAWDRFLRRILVFTQRADDTDGTCLSTFSGYYPVPLGVGMTQPIPTRAPRAGRSTPFFCKVYGDASEAVPGVKVTPSVGTSDLVGAPPFTDADGEAVITLVPDAPGTDTLDVSAEV